MSALQRLGHRRIRILDAGCGFNFLPFMIQAAYSREEVQVVALDRLETVQHHMLKVNEMLPWQQRIEYVEGEQSGESVWTQASVNP